MSQKAGQSRGTRALCVATLALLAAGAAPARGAETDALYTPAEASAVLDDAVDALTAPDGAAVDATEEIRDLAAAIPYLDGSERRQARAIVARPPANGPDAGSVEPFGAEWTVGATNSRDSYDSPGGNFRIHWVTVSSDAPSLADTSPANGVPDYVELVAARADASEATENGTLGWPDPKSDGTRGGGSGLTDIYLSNIGAQGIFGYAAPDDNSQSCRQPPFHCFAYLVLDDDYSQAEFPDYNDPDIPLSVTTAHEYNHVLQFGIDSLQDSWMFESTAVWAEEQVFAEADDWIFYVDAWVRGSQLPITSFDAGGGLRVYGTGVWNHFLDSRFGKDVVLDSWERSRQSTPKDFAVGAYDLGIRANGGPGFAKEFGRFAAATSEWRAQPNVFSGEDLDADEHEFRDVRRNGSLRSGGRAKTMVLDHTAYRLLQAKPGGDGRLKLRVRAPRNVRTAIALVGRDGPALAGAITTKLKYLPRGGRDAVTLGGAHGFERITAVLVNADGRVNGFAGGDWNYTRDNERFRLSLR
jgi:hypothetical protein